MRAEARAAFAALFDAGWSAAAVADAYDVPERTVSAIQHRLTAGRPSLPGLVVSRRVLSGPVRVPTVGMVPAWPTVRKLQALACDGWSSRPIAAEVGVSRSTITALSRGRRSQVTAMIAAKVDVLFRRDASGGCAQTVRMARARGWVPAEFWVDIEDPNEVPQPPSPETGLDLGEAMMLARTRCDREVAARRLGCASWKSLEGMLRNRRGGRDVIEKFKEER